MSRYGARIIRLEQRLVGGADVARILRIIDRADNKELDRLIISGDLVAMTRKLSVEALDRLIAEIHRVIAELKAQSGSGGARPDEMAALMILEDDDGMGPIC